MEVVGLKFHEIKKSSSPENRIKSSMTAYRRVYDTQSTLV